MNQENLKLNKEKQSKDTNTIMTQILELSDKQLKADIINTFQQPITQLNTFKNKCISKNLESISEDSKGLKINLNEQNGSFKVNKYHSKVKK